MEEDYSSKAVPHLGEIMKFSIKVDGKEYYYLVDWKEYRMMQDWENWGVFNQEEFRLKYGLPEPEPYKSSIEMVEGTGKTVREVVGECFLKMMEIQDETMKTFTKDLLTKIHKEEDEGKYKWLI